MLILLLGTNLGDREHHLETARKHLSRKIGRIQKVSSIYETESWGNPDQPDYLNQIICMETKFEPGELLHLVLSVEKKMGRVRSEEKYASRIIDIDILFYNDLIWSTSQLVIPHPKIYERRFVLQPMAEVCPEFIHPSAGKNMKQLLTECEDSSRVVLFK